MDERDLYERLDSTASDPADLFEHFEDRSVDGRRYHALTDARHGVERGTVVVENSDTETDADGEGDTDADGDTETHAEDEGDTDAVVVRGYPSIPRVLVLETGIEAVFEATETVVLEEKLDGFNVRIADVGDVLAFTRGGYVCPYTTARVRTLLDTASFFADHPETMLCAELIGPETPYTTHDYADVDSHAVRVFGIRDRESGRPLSVARRRELCDTYGFEQPRQFGRYEPSAAVAGVREAIEDLDRAGREGVVMRTADGRPVAKYTTEAQHHDDLAQAFSLPFDYGREFLFSRVVREAFQAAEFEESEDRLRERAHDLGESILLPAVETIREVTAGEAVGDRHTVRGEEAAIDALLAHLREQGLTVQVETDRREDGHRVVEFLKVAASTTDRTRDFLEGGTYDE